MSVRPRAEPRAARGPVGVAAGGRGGSGRGLGEGRAAGGRGDAGPGAWDSGREAVAGADRGRAGSEGKEGGRPRGLHPRRRGRGRPGRNPPGGGPRRPKLLLDRAAPGDVGQPRGGRGDREGGTGADWRGGSSPGPLGDPVSARRDKVALVSVRSIWNQDPGFSRASRGLSAA